MLDINYQMGVDIDRNWEFKDGDLKLVKYNKNIAQSVANRLNCKFGALAHFYEYYGSDIDEYLGDPNEETYHEYIRLEIIRTLKQDPRVEDDINVSLTEAHGNYVCFNIEFVFIDGTIFNNNFVIDGDEISVMDIEDMVDEEEIIEEDEELGDYYYE